MNSAAISADIISYTLLDVSDKRKIDSKIKEVIHTLSEKYVDDHFFGRSVQGDYIECALKNPTHALRISLLLKTYIKSLELSQTKNNELKYFKEHGIRLAVAVAPLNILDTKNGIIDGDAIYMSGRAIKNLSTSDKKKVIIKNTMFFKSTENNLEEQFDTIFSLLDVILSRCSAKQCEVVYHKLMGLSEKEICKKLNKNQSTISQHSNAAGWQSIEKSVIHFENTVN
jgi:hypothetical protein